MSYIEYVTDDQQSQDPLPELARTNDFTMGELEQNRNGKISDQQMGKLLSRAMEPVKYPGMALLGWLTCCFIVKTIVPRFVLVIVSMMGIKGIGILFGAVTLACLGSVLVAVLRTFSYVTLLINDLSAGKAAFLDGRATVSRERHDGLGMDQLHGETRVQCSYVVQNEYFAVNEEAAGALPSGGRFRIYYAPKSKLMLSIEPAPASKDQSSSNGGWGRCVTPGTEPAFEGQTSAPGFNTPA